MALQDQATENQCQQDLLTLTLAKEIQSLHTSSEDAESKLKQELEEMSASYDQLKVNNDLDVEVLKVISKAFLNQLNGEIQALIQTSSLPETSEVQPTAPEKKSLWKKTRRFFGLRKP